MDHTRHSGLFDASQASVTLVGAGGIGAITAVTLAKMGVQSIVVYDDDEVSEVNLPTQFHRLCDLGRKKVFGLEETIQIFSDDTAVFPDDTRVGAESALFGTFVISAVDSIAARKAVWQAVQNGSCDWYLDARMSAEEFHLYAVKMRGGDCRWYESILSREDDARVPDLPCTAKATIYCAAMAAGHIGATVRKIITGITPARLLVHNILTDNLFTVPYPRAN